MIKRPIIIITISYIIGILWGIYLKINIFPFCIFCFICNLVFGYLSQKIDYKYCFKVFSICIIIILISNLYVLSKEKKFYNINSNANVVNGVAVVLEIDAESEYYYNYVVKIKQIINVNENNNEKSNDNGNNTNNANDTNNKNINSLKDTKIILRVKKQKNNNTSLNDTERIKYGDLICFQAERENISTKRNFKGFDYTQYLQTKNIYSICKCEKSDIKILKRNEFFITSILTNNLRTKIKTNLNILLPNESANIAIALLIGDSSQIEETQKEKYNNASLSHILAISGMHVSYVIIGIGAILKKCDNRKSKVFLIFFLIFFAKLTGSSPSILRAVIMGILAVMSKLLYRKSDILNNICFSCLIILILNPYNVLNLGFQLSFLGTLGIILFNENVEKFFSNIKDMLKKKENAEYEINLDNKNNEADKKHLEHERIKKYINTIKYYLRKVKRDTILNLLIKVEKILKKAYKLTKLKPEEQTQKINKLLYKYDKKLNKINIWSSIKKILAVSISANILIFPILIYQFNNISLTFLISNILITPILGIMSFFGYITCIISIFSIKIASIFAIVFNIILKIFELIANFTAGISITRFLVTTPSLFTIILTYIIIFYFKIFYNKKHKKFLIKILQILIIIVVLSKLFQYNNSNFKIYFIDVGQGDSTLIVTRTNKTILIDGGGSETSDYDVGKNVLVPYLLDRKIKTIDYMIFSHFDSDHCKGLFTVMEKLEVKNVVISKQGENSENFVCFTELVKNKKINVIVVKAGNRLIIDKYTYFDILWPTDNLVQENILNNNSIVCKLNYLNTSILFTGDIEEIAEKQILQLYNKHELQATILKVAHHGSKSSSMQEFLDEVKPSIAVIGVGENNKYGHPSYDVLERFKSRKTSVFRTDESGEIVIFVNKNGEIVEIEKCINEN